MQKLTLGPHYLEIVVEMCFFNVHNYGTVLDSMSPLPRMFALYVGMLEFLYFYFTVKPRYNGL